MPKCPKCHKGIEYLDVNTTELIRATWDPADGFEIDDTWTEEEVWKCPECGEKLFEDQGEAEKFFEEDQDAQVPKVQ